MQLSEQQMREAFESWAEPRGYSLTRTTDSYMSKGTRSAWRGFLACARVLEQFAVDAYDLGWLSCVEWSGRDDLAADMQSPAYLNQRNLRLKALAEKPNAAMSAALEDGNATE